jgi:hypothetical protein
VIEKIEPIPKIPEALRLAALQRKLIPFIGAGVSQLGGYPGWDQFANTALQFFVGKGKLSHAQFDQIRSLSSRVKLSLALELEAQHSLPIEFKELVTPSDKQKEGIGDGVYRDLSRLATTFITTNHDDWLDRMPPAVVLPSGQSSSAQQLPATSRRRFRKHSEITVENLDIPHAVFHIHGSVHERASMALTTVDYLKRYSSHRIDGTTDRENPLLTFLQTLFQLKNVRFIGYSLGKLEPKFKKVFHVRRGFTSSHFSPADNSTYSYTSKFYGPVRYVSIYLSAWDGKLYFGLSATVPKKDMERINRHLYWAAGNGELYSWHVVRSGTHPPALVKKALADARSLRRELKRVYY